MKLAKLKRFLPFLIGVAIFLFAGGKVGWSEVFRIISTANLTLIAAVMLFTIVEFAVKSWRQSLFLKKISKTEFGPVKSAQIFSIGIFANEFLPAGTGELLRAYIIKRLAKVGFGKPLAPLLIERSFDTFFLLSVALLGINLLFAEQVSAAGASLLLVVLLSIFFFTAIFKKSFGVKIVRLFSFLKKTFLSGFYKALEKTSLSFEEMRKIYAKDKVLLMQTFLLTVLVWSFEAFVQQILFSALGWQVDYFSAFAIISLSLLIGVFSFIPGGFGARDFAYAFFASLIGIPMEVGFSVSILYRAVIYVWLAPSVMYSALKLKLSVEKVEKFSGD